MIGMRWVVFCVLAMMGPALAEDPGGQAVADATTFGAVAILAPLCGLRDEAWARDLRRAAREAASHSRATDDAALAGETDAARLGAALGYGEMEGLEDLAADTPAATCRALGGNPVLARSDGEVARFRALRDGKPVG